jgi:hypothetical protein
MTACTDCGREHDRDAALCFRCHLQTIRFGFQGGGGYGRQNFHERTNKEVADEHYRNAKNTGVVVEPVGKRWV